MLEDLKKVEINGYIIEVNYSKDIDLTTKDIVLLFFKRKTVIFVPYENEKEI